MSEGVDTRLVDGSFPMKIGEVTYNASMLTDRDYGDIDNWIKSMYIALATNASKMLGETEKKELRVLALGTAISMTWGTDEGLEIMTSLSGLLKLGHQMCRKRHPQLTYEQFEKEAYKNLNDSLDQINIAYGIVHSIVDKKKEEDVGGSSTGSEKSQ